MDATMIYEKYYLEILNFLTTKVESRETAEDLTQDAFVKMVSNIAYYDPKKGAVRTWVFNYVRNTLYDHYRTEKESRTSVLSSFADDEGNDNSPVPVAYAEDSTVAVNKRRTVRKVIRTAPELSENERQIGIMYYNMRFKYKEIAESLELPMGTVKGLISRLKNKLEPKLAHLGATAM